MTGIKRNSGCYKDALCRYKLIIYPESIKIKEFPDSTSKFTILCQVYLNLAGRHEWHGASTSKTVAPKKRHEIKSSLARFPKQNVDASIIKKFHRAVNVELRISTAVNFIKKIAQHKYYEFPIRL